MKKTGLIIIAMFVFKLSFSCSCYPRNKLAWDFLFDTDIVFSGKVVKIDTVDYKKIIHLEVIKKYKNTNSNEIQVMTNMGGPDCGIKNIYEGEEWLIFGDVINDTIFTNRCTNSCKSSQGSYLTKISRIEDLISRYKKIEIKNEKLRAKGLLNENGLIGKWKINSNKGIIVENQYYSQHTKLDSSKTLIKNSIVYEMLVYNDSIVKKSFFISGNLYKKTIEYDSIYKFDLVNILKTFTYNENGNLDEVSSFYSHYDLKFLRHKNNTFGYKKYFESGILKESIQSDIEDNIVRKLYNKKGKLKRVRR